MGRPKESRNKKEVRNRKEKNRKNKEKKRLERKENKSEGKKPDDMIAYVDEFGNITSTPQDSSQRTKVKAEDIEVSVPKNKDIEEQPAIRTGVVSFFNDAKGYGFIRDLATQESIFVHINRLIDPIKEGNLVTFEVEKGPKGSNAFNVKLEK